MDLGQKELRKAAGVYFASQSSLLLLKPLAASLAPAPFNRDWNNVVHVHTIQLLMSPSSETGYPYSGNIVTLSVVCRIIFQLLDVIPINT